MKRKFNTLLVIFLTIGLFVTTPSQAQDIPPFIGEGPLTVIDSVSTEYELPFCANESFQVPLPGGICVEGIFEVASPDLVLIENLGADGFKLTPLAEVTVNYTSDNRTCEDGTVIEATTYTYHFFPNPICTSESLTIAEYLYVHSFCEGEVPSFFPDPPVLQAPCVSGSCSIYYVEVKGEWMPVDGGEPFPPLSTTEYIIRYSAPPCPVSECGMIGGTLNQAAYEEAIQEYKDALAGYDGRLGLIEINNCQEEFSEEDADMVLTICQGESVTLKGYNNPIDCPCGQPTGGPVDCFPFPQPGGFWMANGVEVCTDCIDHTVSPETTTLYTNLTPGFQCPLPPPGSGPQGPRPPEYPAGPVTKVLVVVEACEGQSSERAELEELMEAYPWAAELVQPDACATSAVTVYTDGNFEFVLIEEGLVASLYLADGTFYCAQSPTFDCLSFYNLSTITSQWTCDPTGNSIGSNPPSTCAAYTGTIFFDTCDDGREFFFAKTTDGQILDIYFDEGIVFDYYDGQPIQFDFKSADFPSPCSIADQAVIVTCIEEINPSCSALDVIDLPDNLCDQCLTEIAVYAYEGETYYAFIADNTTCADGLTIVSNCATGTTFCMDGGIVGFAQCTDFFDSALKLESIAKEDCEGCLCPAIFAPVCGADGSTYSNECEAACAGVEVVAEGECLAGPNCSVTISNTQCRQIGVYDVNGNFLTTIESGPFGNAPFGTPTPTWTDPNPLLNLEERIYIFKEADFELGRTIATCATPEIDTRNPYAAGCNDGLSLGIYTNTGCRNVDLYLTNGSVVSSLAPGESDTLTATNYIYIAIAGRDTVAIFSDRGGDIDSGGCDEGCFCIALYDPVCGVDGRTYGNACEAGCAGVAVAYDGECADALVPPCFDVAGVDFGLCEAIMGVAVVNGECTYVSGCGNYVVGGIDYNGAFFPSVEICAQSCTSADPVFDDFPWLTDLVDPFNCTNERVSIYSDGTFSFIYVETTASKKVFFEDGSFYCESVGDFDCIEAYGFSDPIATWFCQEENCFCDLVYAPVCGVDGKTYSNACVAACEGVEILSRGECDPVATCNVLALIDVGDFCGTCTSEMSIYEYQGKNYLVFLASDTDGLGGVCTDGITTVESCDLEAQGNFCSDGGIAGLNECEDFFREARKLSVVMARENCSSNADCSYVETIRLNPCDPAVIETSIYEYNGENYVVTIPDPTLLDAGRVVKRCSDGSDFCIESPFSGFPPCGDFFEVAEKLEVLASRADCSTSNCSNVYVSGGLFEIVINDGRLSLPLDQLVFSGVEYFNNATGVGGIAPECFQTTCSPEIRIPVAVTDGNNEFTVTIHFEGGESCRYPVTVLTQEDCICPAVFDPVCGVDGNTYGNACEAVCAGVEIVAEGACIDGCGCAGVYDPVCGVDGKTYSNDCEAFCAGVEVASEGECSMNANCDLLASILLPADLCGSCFSEIAVYEYQGKNYLVTIASDTDGQGGVCNDFQTTVQSCGNGNNFCVDGGIAGLNDCEAFFEEATKVQVVVARENCNVCLCPAVAIPVCGVDGNTYINECKAACAGVEVAYEGVCEPNIAEPCTDLAGVDFGDCRAVMGIGMVNGQCITVSGCLNYVIDGIDYSEAFFPTVELCMQACPIPPGDPLFAAYPWLTELVDPTNCENDKVTVYQSDIYTYLYVENTAGKGLYFQDGLFYCQDSETLDCRAAYNLTEVVTTWSCNGSGSNCDNPLEQEWLRSSLGSECTGSIYQIDYNGTPAIYVTTLCECVDDSDQIFTCDGEFICAVGRIAPDSRCEFEVSNQLTVAQRIWAPACDCDCPVFQQPVCGVDGKNYPSLCAAECAGVEIASNGDCAITTTLTPPCYDVAGVDFGDCDAVLGVAIVNGTCTTLSGCDVRITGIDYSASFFPTVEICQQTCSGLGNGQEVFTNYPWLTDFINLNNCEDEKVTVYQSSIFQFLYVERGASGELYFQDGTFYCQDSEGFDCRTAYSLAEVVGAWSCGTGNQIGCVDVLEQSWMKDIQRQDCTGKIYGVQYNGQPAIYVENRCLCILPDAGNNVYNCSGDLLCNLGAFGPIGSGCDPVLGEQIVAANIIWQPACACDCLRPFPVCGSDGNTYSSDCEATCAGVEVIGDGACTPSGGPIFEGYPWLLDLVNPNSCQTKAISEFDFGGYSFIYIFENANRGTLYLGEGTFYCQDQPRYDCLEAYGLSSDMISRTWSCSDGLIYDAAEQAEQRNKEQAAYFVDALTVFPNPTKGQFNIQINDASKEEQLLTVVDLYGRILQKHTLQADAPALTIAVDLSSEPDGLYMVVLKARGQAAIRKAVVKSGL